MTAQLFTNASTPDDERRRQEKLDEALIEGATESAFGLLKQAIEAVGGMDAAAGITRIDRSDLRKAVERSGPGRYLRFEAIVALGPELARRNPALATRLGFALVRSFGLGVFPLVTISVEEENARLREIVRQLPKGEEILAEVQGVRR